ncbi:hypothetical protein MBLNU459_g7747t1 [Dothideomycetes sp. NU459]
MGARRKDVAFLLTSAPLSAPLPWTAPSAPRADSRPRTVASCWSQPNVLDLMSDAASCVTPGPALRPAPERATQKSSTSQSSSTTSISTASTGTSESASHLANAVPLSGDSATSGNRDEGRRASRRRSAEVVAESKGDVQSFMEELEHKRRQLDEQIHKYIAQKEREYKLYERELRTKYRSAVQQEPVADESAGLKGPGTPRQANVHKSPSGRTDWPKGPPAEDEDQGSAQSQLERNTAVSGLEDTRPSAERERELLGLFTPAFLPLLDSKSPELNRSPSAPLLTDGNAAKSLETNRQELKRASTEPHLEARGPGKLERLGLTQRTPSSGSDQGRALISALKSSNPHSNLPKRKRVSIKLDVGKGVEVVHPSDNVPADGNHTSMHHSEASHRQTRLEKGPVQPPVAETQFAKTSASGLVVEPGVAAMTPGNQSGLTIGLLSRPDQNHSQSAILESNVGIPASPFAMDEDLSNATGTQSQEKQDDEDDLELDLSPDRSPPSASPFELSPAISGSPDSYFAPPESLAGIDLPINSFRSPSSSFVQPTSPGFSRPSVTKDPELAFVEDTSVDTPAKNSFYGSFTRPSASRQAQNSLGGSYMQRNAEQLIRRRQTTDDSKK